MKGIMGKSLVYLALGGNLGDVEKTFQGAVSALEKGGLENIKTSPFYKTKPVGCEEGASPFLNGVLSGEWEGTGEELLNLCQKLEVEAGRPIDHPHWHSRTLDIDIILFGQKILSTPRLTVPHPLAHKRSFVLEPLTALAPEANFPNLQKTASQLWDELQKEENKK